MAALLIGSYRDYFDYLTRHRRTGRNCKSCCRFLPSEKPISSAIMPILKPSENGSLRRNWPVTTKKGFVSGPQGALPAKRLTP